MTDSGLPAQHGDFLLYRTDDGGTRLQVRFDSETVWLTQAQIAELFQTTPQNVIIHLREICDSDEVDAAATCKDYLQVRLEGTRQAQRKLKHYSLPAIVEQDFDDALRNVRKIEQKRKARPRKPRKGGQP